MTKFNGKTNAATSAFQSPKRSVLSRVFETIAGVGAVVVGAFLLFAAVWGAANDQFVAPETEKDSTTFVVAETAPRVASDVGESTDEKATQFSFGTTSGERRTSVVGGVEYAFRWANAGKFSTGSPESEEGRDPIEKLREVELTRGFWILETEVTQAMWSSVCGDNPSKFQGERRPVDSVGQAEIAVFCERWKTEFCKTTGIAPENVAVSLPTEAQWEYAARAGSTGPFSGGTAEEIAWFGDKTDGGTHNVATKKPNSWGLYDMSGNLWEWCSDRFAEYPTDADGNALPVVDPTGATPEECPGDIRVDRGGCWDSDARECRNANRGFYDGDRKGPYVGFRFVVGFK